jgi:hypothetical protein
MPCVGDYDHGHGGAVIEDCPLVVPEPDVTVITENDPGRHARLAQGRCQCALTIEVLQIAANGAPDAARVVPPELFEQLSAPARGRLTPFIAGLIIASITREGRGPAHWPIGPGPGGTWTRPGARS